MTRIISIVLLILILVGAVALVFAFFRSSPKVKVLTINSEGKFNQSELKMANDEVLKIENKDDRKHTVRNVANNTNVVTDLETDKTSGEIVFDDNSRTELALADDKNVKSAVLVGNAPPAPQVEQNPNPSATTTTSPATNTTNNNAGEPLPSTGPSNNLIYVMILLVGILAFSLTYRLLPASLNKYLVRIDGSEQIFHQPETTLINFKTPQK